MIDPKQPPSLFQLLEQYSSSESSPSLLQLILTHDELIPHIKNQSQIIKKIFTYNNLAYLITFLQHQNYTHAQQLKTVPFDPSGQSVPLFLKLPFKAMQILCCECPLINELLFEGTPESPTPLLPQLLSFLDQQPHYQLACYFSKAISAITKRVASATHKYNSLFAQQLFGTPQRPGALFKSAQHLYSLTTIDYIMKWLTFTTKPIKQDETEPQDKPSLDFRRTAKRNFLLQLIHMLNTDTLSQECASNVPPLFEQMLLQTEKNNKINSTFQIKSLPPTLPPHKLTTYDLLIDEQLISQVFKAPEQQRLTLSKLSLVKVFLFRYFCELSLMLKDKNEDTEHDYKILQIITPDHLQSLIEWIVSHLKTLLRINAQDTQKQSSPFHEKQPNDSRVLLPPADKMLILTLTELLRIVHSLTNFRPHLIDFYNTNSASLVTLIRKLMALDNNLIQLETSKIVLNLLRGKGRDKNKQEIPYAFARKLLTHSILQLVQRDSARPHVIEWADIILTLQPQHIFEDYEQEFEWQHIRETVEDVKKLHIGQNRFIQANIDCFYSQEKALVKYSNFLNGFKVQVLYDDKKQTKYVSISERKAEIQKEGEQRALQQDTQQELSSLPPEVLEYQKGNYLTFDLQQLIEQL